MAMAECMKLKTFVTKNINLIINLNSNYSSFP